MRETPLNGQTLRHLVTLDEAGAVVLPASPAFYAGATHIQDLVDFVAGRVLDAAGVPHRCTAGGRASSAAARERPPREPGRAGTDRRRARPQRYARDVAGCTAHAPFIRTSPCDSVTLASYA